MRRGRWAALSVAALVSGLWLVPGRTGQAGLSARAEANVPRRVSYELGERLFRSETFEGNGRTCATCHDPRNEFTVSPELVQARYELDPSHPLFRAVDSEDGQGHDYTKLLEHALFRVTIPLHPNVVWEDHPERRSITVWRGAPSIANVALSGPYLQDGRAATLQAQALGAIDDHIEPGRRPLAKELDAIAAFESELYYPLRLRSIDDTSDPLPKDPGFSIPVQSPAAQRGRDSFELRCLRCHGGELGQTPRAPTPQFTNVLVSDINALNLPLLRLAFHQPDGTVVVAFTPDPGRAAITGDLRDLNAFDTPSLRGIKHTAPYFHDNSAATLPDVIQHYNDVFQFQMTQQEKDDLASFLELF
jgi:cytochrome c peroxidase